MNKSIVPINDVARPNESAPSDTSVPVIVNNRPILRDPMMAGDVPTVGKPASETAPLSTNTSKINIQPISSDVIESEKAKDTKPVEKVTKPAEVTDAEQSEISSPSNEEPAKLKSTADKQAIETETAAKREAEMETLVDTRKYNLPINTVENRRIKRFLLMGVGLSLLLAIVWIDIALDAGLIKIGGLKALTHIFST